MIGADPEGSVYSGGTGRPYLVEGVGEDIWPTTYDRHIADRIEAVSDRDSFLMTRALAREEGLLVGGSCGLAAAAAIRVAHELPADALMVVLLPDSGRGYLTKIFNDEWMYDYGFLTPPSTSPTVGDLLSRKSRELPELVHVHPDETVGAAIGVLREYGVSQMPVVKHEPPVRSAEVVGSVIETELLAAVFSRPGVARPADRRAPVATAADRRRGRVPGDRGRRAGEGQRPPRPRQRRSGRNRHPFGRAGVLGQPLILD